MKEQASQAKEATAKEIIEAIVTAMLLNLEPMHTRTLAPGLFHVYLREKDYDRLKGVFVELQREAVTALDEKIASFNKASRGGLRPMLKLLAAKLKPALGSMPEEMRPSFTGKFKIGAMRGVVTRGTARAFAASTMAGKTGAAQNVKRVRITQDAKPGFSDRNGKLVFLGWKRGDPIPEGLRPAYDLIPQPSHGWFIGFAPYNASRRIAFSVLIENGGFGGRVAAPIADEIVAEAKKLGLIQ